MPSDFDAQQNNIRRLLMVLDQQLGYPNPAFISSNRQFSVKTEQNLTYPLLISEGHPFVIQLKGLVFPYHFFGENRA